MTDKPNAELAYKVLDHIDAHPEQWDQGLWWIEQDDDFCGTVGCFAGWTCALSGERPTLDEDGDPLAHGVPVAERAAQLLGFAAECELDDAIPEGRSLFSPTNSRRDLGRLVAGVFGPRPDGAS
jgi:hypothetical protein